MISALRDLALTSVKLVEERLRLLGAELQEQKWRAVEAVLWLAIALVLGALALLVASLAVVLSVWPDPHARILAHVSRKPVVVAEGVEQRNLLKR
ncbi:MAG: phage holin family protein [Verrucomicrobiota bacterium]